ncbi:hypothetical protein DRQ50_14725 [bacterium]|nr:MAG: hypothetical protein DRQ50_14725 [bacterium]
MGGLINPATRDEVIATVNQQYAEVRRQRAEKNESRVLLPLAEARANGLALDWSEYRPPAPKQVGVHRVTATIAELREVVDWTPFFHTWRLPGSWPAILDDPETGAEARRLVDEANALLDTWEKDGSVSAHGVAGLLPAARDGDDLVFETPAGAQRVPFLRQQRRSAGGRPNLSLVDFVAPKDGPADWVGGFVVTVRGAGVLADAREAAGDDYDSILIKAVADRLAEAFAEHLHRRVRTELWGYAADEDLDNTALVAEGYRGIRPAPGYPACPDHYGKHALFELLDAAAATGVELTENWAMTPAASVAGWYFSHAEARYFGMGRLGRDQVADYARRAGLDEETAARWLGANLD